MTNHKTSDHARLIRIQRLGPTVITATVFALMASLLGVLIAGFLRMAPPDDEAALARNPSADPAVPGEQTTGEQPVAAETPATGRPGQAATSVSTSKPKDYLALRSPVEIAGAISSEQLHRSASFAGIRHDYAIWTQPVEDRGTAQVSYMLEGQFTKLRGIAGISDPGNPPVGFASAGSPAGMFRIYGDGNLLWQSDTLAGFGAAQGFEVDVAGIEMIALVAESEAAARESSFAWGDVELLAADTSP